MFDERDTFVMIRLLISNDSLRKSVLFNKTNENETFSAFVFFDGNVSVDVHKFSNYAWDD